jgi:hypothetical protein
MRRVILPSAVALVLLLLPAALSFSKDQDKDKRDAQRKEFERQWTEVVAKYPAVAHAYLRQQIEHTRLLTAMFAEPGEFQAASPWRTLASARLHDLCCEGVWVGSQLIVASPQLCERVLCKIAPIDDIADCINDCFTDKYDQRGQDRPGCLTGCLKPDHSLE